LGKSIFCSELIDKLQIKRAIKMRHFYLFLLPTIAYFIIFHYIPMYGITLAFKDYKIMLGIGRSPWVGFQNFERLFQSVFFSRVLKNTVIISLLRLLAGFPMPIMLALFLNEVYNVKVKKVFQTVSYLPYFMSWVVLAGMIRELLSLQRGAVNYIITLFGGEPIAFLVRSDMFRGVLIATGIWQGVGWGSIIYLAAISAIPQDQYESAYIDGASRFKQIVFITIPHLVPVMVILFILNLGGILSAGFDQIFNLYSAQVYDVSDIIDTYVYRVGLVDMKYSFSTAASFFKNIIGFLLVLGTNFVAKRISNYGLW